jgi:UMF1 family MFS transporter
MLGLFAYIGAVSTTGLYFLHGTNYLFGGGLFILANVSFGASIVIYNAFLPELAAPEERDDVSSKGWALGYLGGGLLLGLNLAFFSQADSFGLTIEDAVRISLASAGIWWALFTVIPLATLRSRQPIKRPPPQGNYVALGFKQLRRTLAEASQFPQTFLFLLAYLLYNDGIQTVIAMASEFGQEELGLSMSTLTTVILMVQFVAFFGALLFNYAAKIVGTKRAIEISLLGWIGVVIYAYGFLQTAFDFYVLGVVIAVVMGGSQALSRSLYSLMIPKGQEAEYFSLYEISDRGTSWLGPFLFGLTLQLSNSYRQAILSLVVFFILGYVLLVRVNVREAAVKARHESPVGT